MVKEALNDYTLLHLWEASHTAEQASVYNVIVHKVAFQGEYKYDVHVFPQGQYTLSLGKHHNRN